MAELPSYVAVRFPDYGETPRPRVERTEMERGVAKQRLLETKTNVEIKATFLFGSSADASAFEWWFYNTIQVVGFFEMTHPRTGEKIMARFVAGDIGTLTPMSPDFAQSYRTVTLEYLR